MKFKYYLIIILFFSMFIICCKKDLSSTSTIINGESFIKENQGFDFSYQRIIDFRMVDRISNEEKSKSLDFHFVYDATDSNYIFMANPIVTNYLNGYKISPDSLNPSIKNMDVISIADITKIDYVDFSPVIELDRDIDILSKPVFVIKTTDSKYAIIEVEEIFTEHNEFKISFKWKYQSDGSTDF